MPAIGDQVALEAGLKAILGTRWSRSDEHLSAYARDASPLALKLALAGRSPYRPTAVAWPESPAEVAALVRLAAGVGLGVVPYGGGSGIVGGALADRTSLVLDTKRLRRVRSIDERSQVATVEAGALGAVLEEELVAHGLTTGHYPQSLYSSTVGGWIAHRGVGTYSSLYGRIEDMILGLEVVLADGSILTTRAAPASAAGPDLKRLFLGSEGTLGIVTAATLQLQRLPAARRALAFMLPDFVTALELAREVVQVGLRPGVVRLYDEEETTEHFGALGMAGAGCMALFVVEGIADIVAATSAAIRERAGTSGAVEVDGDAVGEHWLLQRFSTAGLCRTLMTPGGVADAIEVATDWSGIAATYARMRDDMLAAAGERGRVYGHASHVYQTGTNVYMIFHAYAADEDSAAERYAAVLSAAMEAALVSGATITHHHGVGLLKAPWMERELGPVGLDTLRRLKRALDPTGVLNPGRLGL